MGRMSSPSIPHALELASLPDRHAQAGPRLRDRHGPEAVYRLTQGNVRPDNEEETIRVSWLSRIAPVGAEAVETTRRISWRGLFPTPDELERQLRSVRTSVNAHDITESAAIAVMALLLDELENAALECVESIGSGADYVVRVPDELAPIGVEVSGLVAAEYPSVSEALLRRKREQLLNTQESGYVSVTVFSHPRNAERVVQSYLHFVRREDATQSTARRKRKRKKT
jgi:hypothetical protein